MGPKRRSTGKKAGAARPQSRRHAADAPLSKSTAAKGPAPLDPVQRQLLAVFRHAFAHVAEAGAATVKQRIQRLKQALYDRAFGAAFADAAPDELEAYAFRWSPTRALGYYDVFSSGEAAEVLMGVLQPSQLERVRWGRAQDASARDPLAAEHADSAALSNATERLALRDEPSKAPGEDDAVSVPVKVVAIGAGAGAEVVALAGVLARLSTASRRGVDFEGVSTHASQEDTGKNEESVPPSTKMPRLALHVVDIAPWNAVLTSLHSELTSPSQSEGQSHTSHSKEQRDTTPLVPPSSLALSFAHRDILAMDLRELRNEVAGARLVTVFFTLNELYAASKGRTTALLLNLTNTLHPGAVLAVVDSAGSYAAVGIGGEGGTRAKADANRVQARRSAENGSHDNSAERPPTPKQTTPIATATTYPMHFLLDHTLLEAASELLSEDQAQVGKNGKGEGNREHGSRGNQEEEKDDRAPVPAARKRRRWRKVHEDRSRWFRLPGEIDYPMDLEDMRMQVHIYERV